MIHAIHLALPQFEVFAVALARVGAILVVFPFLGARTVPARVKLALAVATAVTVMPFIPAVAVPREPAALALGLLAEALIGVVLGLVVQSLFAGFEVAGEMMGNQMGFGVAQLFDPASGRQLPLVAQFQTTIVALLFLALNLHVTLVHAVGESFRIIPVFGATLGTSLLEDVVKLFGNMFVVAVKLAAPVVIVTLTVQLAMGLMGRTVSQLNMFVLSFPLTIGLGLLALGLALPSMAGVYAAEFESLVRALDGVMRDLAHE
ncbi:flagellar biosynthetic protein FliR [Nitrospira sp.]|nr:flagellar biosynthetic protein FliR [Nitrospira sp.]